MYQMFLHRSAGFVYQYINRAFFEQDLQGGITIRTETNDNIDTRTVTNGTCQDFLEFREVLYKTLQDFVILNC